MDNLVLIRVAAALHAAFARATLREVREEPPHRIRILFAADDRARSLIVSLRPELPWLGRPLGRSVGRRRGLSPFGATLQRALRGVPLEAVRKPTVDRWVSLDFAGGARVVVELAPHRANLVLLDPRGRCVASARRPKSAQARLGSGSAYRPPELPGGLLDPFSADTAAVDALLARHQALGEASDEILRRRCFSLGAAAARLVVEEARASGRSPGEVLVARLSQLERGEVDPVVEAAGDPWAAAQAGTLDADEIRLWPWPPRGLAPERRHARTDAAATAGLFHESLDRARALRQRGQALAAILGQEIRRLRRAERQVARDLEGFTDPDRHRRWGEALLAGLQRARRVQGTVIVPDPYGGSDLHVPVAPETGLADAAGDHFRHFRRAERGLRTARRRADELARGRLRLERLAARYEDVVDADSVEGLERALRAERIPVALEPATRTGREAARVSRPRLEGVRVFTTDEGLTVLAGKSARDNQRLTFKLAAPEDFWLHAQGRAGAHVVLRNDQRLKRPPHCSLEQAAAIAAWFSDGRALGRVEVLWTRRKYVRKRRGGPAGAVLLKRFETVVVRPGLPRSAASN